MAHIHNLQKNNMKCKVCKTVLSGRQKMYCSNKCKSGAHGANSYDKQQKRAKERKIKLIKNKGGECQICGYSKNYSALVFHHRDPDFKSFGIDGRKCSNSTWKALVDESLKCDLLCYNCHMEHHHPQCLL